ncbi:MAG: selenocysteine-specific translation elongation factor [Candidatus Latescibacteria bacterium]|nr:selenocysteine-specific translation elongation factor [Candidatus Latescibacterota bacterium]
MLPPITIATAGHIDHGKTALVKALTGTDTDRLKEEKERQITIDLGFAFLDENIAIIDVPGHEKFIKNMVAGVSAIDLALFVIAADDGIMPQTREHLDILSLLGVQRGIIVMTKIDLVDEEWHSLVEEDIHTVVTGTFLENAPLIPVSAVTGEGIERLKQTIDEIAATPIERRDSGIFRMPIDRSFTIRGFGTIVTGTVLSGRLSVGETVQLLPQMQELRVRSLQTHGSSVETVSPGSRAAINLSGIEKEEVERGDVLVTPGYLQPGVVFDGRLTLLRHAPKSLRNRGRLRIHLGTKEFLGRVILLEHEELIPGASGFVQIRLEAPGVAIRGDRFVIRRYSPPLTIGGGVILDPHPSRHKRFHEETLTLLSVLEHERLEDLITARLKTSANHAKSPEELSAETGISVDTIRDHLCHLPPENPVFLITPFPDIRAYHVEHWSHLQQRIVETLDLFHRENPLKPGLNRDELRGKGFRHVDPFIFEHALDSLISENRIVLRGPTYALTHHTLSLTPSQQRLREAIASTLRSEKLATSRMTEIAERLGERPGDVQTVTEAMLMLGDIVKIDETVYLHAETVTETRQKLIDYLRQARQITVSEFRELVGTTRKYALPLLNYFDRIGLTERHGDVRTLGQSN